MKVWRGLAFHMAAAVDDAFNVLRDQAKYGERERDLEAIDAAKRILAEASGEWELVTSLFTPRVND